MKHHPRSAGTPRRGFGRSALIPIVAGAFLLAPAWNAIADYSTAYDALRLIGNQRDPSYYNRLISISGKDGSTQPRRWVLLFFDPNTRYGLREIEVQDGYIVGERTPEDPKLSPEAARLVMDLQKLNLNSDGAFKIANSEAGRVGIGFDSITYVLRRHEVTETPVWVLDLKDYRKTRVGAMLLNAESGAVIRPPTPGTQHTYDQPPPGQPPGPQPSPPPGGYRSRPQPTPPRGDPNEGGFIGRASRTFDKAGRDVERVFLNIGGTLEQFFTGRRTIPSEPD